MKWRRRRLNVKKKEKNHIEIAHFEDTHSRATRETDLLCAMNRLFGAQHTHTHIHANSPCNRVTPRIRDARRNPMPMWLVYVRVCVCVCVYLCCPMFSATLLCSNLGIDSVTIYNLMPATCMCRAFDSLLVVICQMINKEKKNTKNGEKKMKKSHVICTFIFCFISFLQVFILSNLFDFFLNFYEIIRILKSTNQQTKCEKKNNNNVISIDWDTHSDWRVRALTKGNHQSMCMYVFTVSVCLLYACMHVYELPPLV